MERRVGLEAAPDDAQLEDWLGQKIDSASEEMEEILGDFVDMVKLSMDDGDPWLWNYARLLNFLATLDNPKMIRVLSAALWTIMEAEVTS
ncbi:hypothetical protein MADRUGA_71 [Mycobacterium phage Madruga]|uniref:Uncharacterized protein n=1 Tax=Mycobacterium phage Madruga TaxID=1675552 RepID=A0A0K1LS08_9CAUD|nr:hypothetical protein MADRUGA_71 [Mycobacterium phage Madruga]